MFGFVGCTPLVLGVALGNGVTLLATAAVFPWALNLWLFGWARMVAGMARLWAHPTSTPALDATQQERLGQGLLWAHGVADGTAYLRVAPHLNRPKAEGWITTLAGTRLPLDAATTYAWAHALSGGELHRLLGGGYSQTVWSDRKPTAHHALACQRAFHQAEDSARADLVVPDRWHTVLSGWLPGHARA
jgi:hypothetical protein